MMILYNIFIDRIPHFNFYWFVFENRCSMWKRTAEVYSYVAVLDPIHTYPRISTTPCTKSWIMVSIPQNPIKAIQSPINRLIDYWSHPSKFLGDHDTDDESELNARNRLNHYHHSHSRHHPSASKPASEDEFAEDELSLGEPSESKILTTSRPTWSTCPTSSRLSRERRGKSPKSLDRRRKDKGNDVGEFHEGMLLDALLQLYPSVAGNLEY